MARSRSVLEIARENALRPWRRLPSAPSVDQREAVRRWAVELVKPPDEHPHFLAAETLVRTTVDGGMLEKVVFVSEDGQPIPSLLWLPSSRSSPSRTVLIANDQGKGAVARSDLVRPLLAAGFAVCAVDSAGTRGDAGPLPFRLGHEFPTGRQSGPVRPTARRRRGFDLSRAVDYLAQRKELTIDRLVGRGLW